MNLTDYIRDVPDFPIPGILFRDITPLLRDPDALKEAVRRMSEPWEGREIQLIAAMEARGFMFGAAMAIRLGAGFIPVRKQGKLPGRTRSVSYTLEYRDEVLQIHEDAVAPGQRVLVVDDVIATGGTARAVVELVEQLGGEVAGVAFLIELSELRGRELLDGCEVHSVITY
ncbi:MAG TPA: adenine phosphoribosyltransferase [Candidatus Dormibacteraeota bacterium]